MKKAIILFLALLFIFSCPYAYASIEGDAVRVEVEFQEPVITPSMSFPGYDRIEMAGTRSLGEVGEPQVPVKGIEVLIPSNKEIYKINLVFGEKVTLPGIYRIEPVQKEYPLSQIGNMKIVPDEPKPAIYESEAIYPSVRYKLTSLQKKMGYSIAAVELYPIEYNPKKGEVSYYKKITVRVRLKSPAKVRARSSGEMRATPRLRTKSRVRGKDKEAVSRLIKNKEDFASLYDQTISDSGPTSTTTTLAKTSLIESESLQALGSIDTTQQYDYVIITHANFKDSFEPLKNRRIAKGLTATIVTTDWIYANYSGARPDGGTDNQTKIRNFIIDAYNLWGTKYVLLAGDGDGSNVGGESGNNIIPARGLADSYDNDIPADLYYACLDGTFDSNHNGIYGEKTDGEDGGEIDLLAEVYIGRAPVDSVTEAGNFVSKTLAYEDSTADDYLNNNYMVGEYLGFGGVSDYATASMEEIRLGTNNCGFTTQGFLSNPDRAMDANTLYDSLERIWSKNDLVAMMNNGIHILNHLGHAYVTYDMKLFNSDVDGLTNSKYFIVYSQGCYPGAFDNRNSGGRYLSSDCIAEHFTTDSAGAVAFIGNSRYGWGAGYSTNGSSQYYDRQFWDALFCENIRELGKMNQDSKEDNIPYLSHVMNRWCYFELNLFGDPALSMHLPSGLILQMTNYSCVETQGNGDGAFDQAESGEITVTLKALNQNAYSVTAALSSSDPYVTVDSAPVNYGTILKGESKDNAALPFKFEIAEDCLVGHQIQLTLLVNDSSGYSKQLDISIELTREQQITTDSKDQYRPVVSGNVIVWADNRNGNADIYAYDLSTNTERQITTNASSQDCPFVSGNCIVWQDNRNGNWDIYAYDLSTNTERQITTNPNGQYYSAISGNVIVWQDYRNGNDDIYAYDLSTNTERQITTDSNNQAYPYICGNHIVWEDNRNGDYCNWDIYAYDLSTNTERQITTHPKDQYRPVVSGNVIVWADNRNGDWDIYAYDLSTNTERQITERWITTDPKDQCRPVVSGNVIVWEDDRNGNWDIYAYDLSTNTERRITTNTGNQYFPVISDNIISWQDNRNGNEDIYLSIFDSTPPSKPIVTDGGAFTNSTTTLEASWTSSDPESGIAEYRYRITQDSPGGTLMKEGWTTANSIIVNDLILENGKSYYFIVNAKNKAGLWSEAGCSDGILIGTPNVFNFSLKTGWNMISLPLEPSDCRREVVLAPIVNKYTQVKSQTQSCTFVSLMGYIGDLKELHAGLGYLIYMTSDASLTISGNLVQTTFPVLQEGWNWAGLTTSVSKTITEVLGTTGFGQIYTIKPGSSDTSSEANKLYYSASFTSFEPGKGYVIQKDTISPTGTIRINNNATYANSTSVILTLAAIDSGSGMGNGAQMKFITIGDASWSTLESYATSKSFVLPSGDGSKMVYVKFKDAAGNWSNSIGANIILDSTPPTGTIRINNNATYANSTSVTLTLAAIDSASGMGSGAQMQFITVGPGQYWSAPEPYIASKSFVLPSGEGSKTVYVKFKDVAGNWSNAVSDSIILQLPVTEYPWKTNANGTLATNVAWNYTMGYQFTPLKDGQITKLGGFYNGTKTVYLWDSTGKLLSSASVTSANNWNYTAISPVTVKAGQTYTVAVYLNGSGGSYRSSVASLPRTYSNIRIEKSCYRSGNGYPTTLTSTTMYGQADIEYKAN